MPDRRDKFYYLAKKERYRSRAAFKLLELQTKFDFLGEGQNILEIGSSPGGWSQIVTSITGTTVFSVDINKMDPLENTVFIRGRVGDKALKDRIREEMNQLGVESFDGIISDAMSRTSGNKDIDHSSSYLICQEVMALAQALLKKDGFVVLKQFQGDLTVQFVNQWKKYFGFSKLTKVAASRESSKEVYIVFKYLKGF